MEQSEKITGIVLAGGRGIRMGGVDKGLVLLRNQSLVQYTINRLMPQVDEIIINANREFAQYQALGFTVLQDDIIITNEQFAGPLAGIQLGLTHAQNDYVLTVPCDSPFLPTDLASRLMQALIKYKAQVAVASSDGSPHPVFCLCKKTVLESLNDYLAQGGRKVSAWQKSLAYVEVDFTDCNDAFINLNTAEELKTLEAQSQHELG